MNRSGHDDLSHLSMLELFRVEAEGQTAALTAGLLELERASGSAAADQRPEARGALLESLMRAAHSLKGAARIVNLGVAVRVAHALEDCFVAAQRGVLRIGQREIDTLLRGVDLLLQISQCNEAGLTAWEGAHVGEVDGFIGAVRAVVQGQGAADNSQKAEAGSQKPEVEPLAAALRPLASVEPEGGARNSELGPPGGERVVRLNAENLNRLLGLAGESLVETRWLRPFTEGMQG